MKRALDNPEYEPPVRDPKAIRTTVIILVLIMLFGGFFIVSKYREKMGEEYEEVKKGRPSMSLGNVRKNFQMKGLDGEIYDFGILSEKVSLMTVISAKHPEASQIIIDELKLAAERFEGQLQIVCISAELEADRPLEELQAYAKQAGIPENWYVLTANSETYSGFIKDGLKLGMISKRDPESGENVLPDIVRLVDRSLNIRGEISDFSFGYYQSVKERAEEYVKQHPEKLSNPDFKKKYERNSNVVGDRRSVMYKNVSYILDHEDEMEGFTEKNNSNRYHTPLIVFGGFIVFIVFMGYRLKINRAK